MAPYFPAARHRAALLQAGALFAAPAFSEKLAAVQVAPAAMRMLQIAPVQAPETGQMLWSPARLEYPSGQLDSVVSPAQARITAIDVQPGQSVKVGAPLATLVSADALRMRHEVSAAQLATATSRAELQRQQDMWARGVGTQSELRLAEARSKETAQELARARHRRLAWIGRRRPHRAARAARRRRGPAPGQHGPAGRGRRAAVCHRQSAGAVDVVAEVFEGDLPLLKTGVAAQVELPTGAAPVAARVQQVGAVVNAESRRAPVQLALTDKQLPAGMQIRVGITIDGPAQMRVPIDIADLYAPVAEVTGGILELDVEGHPCALGDGDLLGNALANLVENALKYACLETGGQIRISARLQGEMVELWLQDNGLGMPRERRASITDRFYRAHEPQPGHGLGLSSVQAIVQLHNGSLQFANLSPGFEVRLPAVPGAAQG